MATDKVLLVATSSAANVLQALETVTQRVFVNARVEVLSTLADWPGYAGKPEIARLLVFPSRHDWRSIYQLRQNIRQQGYRAIAVLWCRQSKWTLPKLFALACAMRHLLVFNENLDCDFLRPRFLLRLLKARLSSEPSQWAGISGGMARSVLLLLGNVIRTALFPVRVLVLLAAAGLLLADKPRQTGHTDRRCRQR